MRWLTTVSVTVLTFSFVFAVIDVNWIRRRRDAQLTTTELPTTHVTTTESTSLTTDMPIDDDTEDEDVNRTARHAHKYGAKHSYGHRGSKEGEYHAEHHYGYHHEERKKYEPKKEYEQMHYYKPGYKSKSKSESVEHYKPEYKKNDHYAHKDDYEEPVYKHDYKPEYDHKQKYGSGEKHDYKPEYDHKQKYGSDEKHDYKDKHESKENNYKQNYGFEEKHDHQHEHNDHLYGKQKVFDVYAHRGSGSGESLERNGIRQHGLRYETRTNRHWPVHTYRQPPILPRQRPNRPFAHSSGSHWSPWNHPQNTNLLVEKPIYERPFVPSVPNTWGGQQSPAQAPAWNDQLQDLPKTLDVPKPILVIPHVSEWNNNAQNQPKPELVVSAVGNSGGWSGEKNPIAPSSMNTFVKSQQNLGNVIGKSLEDQSRKMQPSVQHEEWQSPQHQFWKQPPAQHWPPQNTWSHESWNNRLEQPPMKHSHPVQWQTS